MYKNFIDKINLKSLVLYSILFILVIITIFPIHSFAGNSVNDDAISRTLCNVIKKLTGPVGKGISTIAIIVLGIGLFLGKLSWAVAVATAIGIGLIFGAANIVDWIGDGSNGTMNNPKNFQLDCE